MGLWNRLKIYDQMKIENIKNDKDMINKFKPIRFLIIALIMVVIGWGCRKNNLENQTLTAFDIQNNLPGIYEGTVTNYYPSSISDLIFNNVKVSLKNSGSDGYLYAFPGLYFNTDSDQVKIDTCLSNYWKVIPDFLLKGPKNQLSFSDSNKAYIINVSYVYDSKLLVIDYKNFLNNHKSHFYGLKISN